MPAVAFAIGIMLGAHARGAAVLLVLGTGLWWAERSWRYRAVAIGFAIAGVINGLPVGRAAAPTDRSRNLPTLGLTTGVVAGVQWTPRGCRYDLEVENGERVRVSSQHPVPPGPGSRVAAYGLLRPSTWGRNPGDGGRGSGLMLSLWSESDLFVLDTPSPAMALIHRVRGALRHDLSEVFSGDMLGLARALTLGDRSGLDRSLTDRFRRLGLSHLLAISGLHIGLLAGVVVVLARVIVPTGGRWVVPAVLALALYAPIAGGSGSVVRAAIMGGIVLTLVARGRRFEPMNVLALAFLVSSGLEPSAVFRPSYALSYLATAGILLYLRLRVPIPSPRSVRAVVHTVGVSVAASLATLAPVTAFFGIVPLGGIPYSAPGGVAVAMALVPLFTGLLLGPVTFLRDLCFLAAWPGLAALRALAFLPLPEPRIVLTFEVTLAISLIALGLVLVVRGARWPAPLGALVAAALAVAMTPRPPVVPEVTLLDVGAGDAIVIRLPDGENLIIDTGRPHHARTVTQAARRLGVAEASLLITHPDEDHDGGAGELLDQGIARALIVAATEEEVERRYPGWDAIRYLSRGDTLWRGDRGEIVCLHPDPEDDDLADNERSLVLRLRWGDTRLLLTGDVEDRGLARMLGRSATGEGDAVAAEVLKVGHHGSPGASPGDFVERVGCGLAVVSCGRSPPEETLRRLEGVGARVVRTDSLGALRLRLTEPVCSLDHWAGGWRSVDAP